MPQSSRHLAIIPAYPLSTRLPGKILKLVGTESLLERVISDVQDSGVFSDVIVATGDDAIAAAIVAQGTRVVLSDLHYSSGLRRSCGAASALLRDGEDFASLTVIPACLVGLNKELLQRHLEALCAQSGESSGQLIARAWATPIYQVEQLLTTKIVKIALGEAERILYCSRAPIPFACEGYEEEKHELQLGTRLIPIVGLAKEGVLELHKSEILGCEKVEEIDLLAAITSERIAVRAHNIATADAARIIEVVDSQDLARANSDSRRLECLTD